MTLDEVTIDSQIPKEDSPAQEGPEVQEEQEGLNIDFGWLRAETGEGSIDDYIEHPMNFNSSRSVARILRGATGLFGSLKLAIIDIALGVFELAKEGKAAN